MKSQKIYIAVSKAGMPLMFIDEEPKRTKTSWTGNHYVNSVIYEQVCKIQIVPNEEKFSLVKQVNMSFENDPELIEFQAVYK